MSRETGGPAFPREDYQANGYEDNHCGTKLGQEGMTLRDYFAAKAMQGMTTDIRQVSRLDGQSYATAIASMSYALADAMIAARASNS